MSFHIQIRPNFWNLKNMSNLYFSETRFFKDHFSLLRWSHPRPVCWYFNHPKFYTWWDPQTHFTYSSFISLTFQTVFLQLFFKDFELREELILLHFFLLHALAKELQIKIWLHHLLPLNSRIPLLLFFWNFLLDKTFISFPSSCLVSYKWDLFFLSLMESFGFQRNLFF